MTAIGFRSAVLAVLLTLTGVAGAAPVSVVDDDGSEVSLEAPARRIVSLAPSTTELLFAAGAGDYVVGAVEYSDYPEAAKAVPRIGGYEGLDVEAILALRPDLLVAWKTGNPERQIAQLRQLGLNVYVSEPRELEDVPTTIERLARLAGTDKAAAESAMAFRKQLADLRARYSGRDPVRVFYEIWYQPLMTINRDHIISKVMGLCGGVNVFGHLPTLVPHIDVEAVIGAKPEVIIASGIGVVRPEWVDDWRRWPALPAVAQDNLFFIPPDIIQRHTPRILQGAETMCELLEKAREKRAGE